MAQNNVQQIETIEHPASGQGREFPPFERQTFPSQLFWLALTFILLYLLMSRVALPRINSILEERRKRVEADLAEAQRRKDESDATILAGEKALADARARAQTRPMKHTKRRRQPLRRVAKKWTQSSPVASPKRKRPLPLRDRRPSRTCMVLRARPRPQS